MGDVEFRPSEQIEAERSWPVNSDAGGFLSREEKEYNRDMRQAFILGVKWARKNG